MAAATLPDSDPVLPGLLARLGERLRPTAGGPHSGPLASPSSADADRSRNADAVADPPALALQGVTVQFGRTLAVHDAALTLARGEIGALLGPSGCGKTTLLRAIAGFVPLAQGRIEVAGRILSQAGAASVAPERRGIGVVFQDYALFPHLDVRRNVGFGLRGWLRADRAARVAELLELVNLSSHARAYPHELSGGQQQRVALARALAPRPALLLLDEPFSSLDAELRERLASEVRGILKQAGTTALVVTHDQFEAFAVADRVGVMRAGRIEQWDTPYNLYHRPHTRFVADFVGHGVLLPGTLTARPAPAPPLIAIELGQLPGEVRGDWISGPPPAPGESRACQVLLRADDLIHDDASPLKAEVVRRAFRGAEFLYTLRLPSGAEVLALVPSHHDHAIGEAIGIRLAADHVVTFADESPAVTSA
jgi:iron(III) transport system ATP-binding protein